MKRVVLLVPDGFDIGAVISLIGSELTAAYIGKYNPKVKLSDASQDEHKPADIVTGREGPERHQTPGGKRPNGEGRDQPVKLEGMSLEQRVLTTYANGQWFLPSDFRKIIVDLGYQSSSADSTLSNMKIKGLLERQGKGPKARYRKVITLQAVK